MLTKQTRAHGLICPFRLLMRGNREREDMNCISDSCMAWRWLYSNDVTGYGYCGLAGVPKDAGPQKEDE